MAATKLFRFYYTNNIWRANANGGNTPTIHFLLVAVYINCEDLKAIIFMKRAYMKEGV
ncbi:hypothetical protein KFZ58_10970 [Virgibacillus sp. NKC19-16]|uniref:hypothetical protein n=1 Tax=Virgibacillus salidurans TaxID=2831673 RepID=UPI001F18559E|nr:hypothetical protein [Virgibacillus sp. NKC19-16]UJL44946.1 hypothetical protein KFZ58_10970 [Virgibacillus sp. NKC19-16]